MPSAKKISKVKRKYKGKRFPPFIQAAYVGNVEDVRILLSEDGMDVNQKDEEGYTALHFAVAYEHIESIITIEEFEDKPTG